LDGNEEEEPTGAYRRRNCKKLGMGHDWRKRGPNPYQ
jgi:hypothetical protein